MHRISDFSSNTVKQCATSVLCTSEWMFVLIGTFLLWQGPGPNYMELLKQKNPAKHGNLSWTKQDWLLIAFHPMPATLDFLLSTCYSARRASWPWAYNPVLLKGQNFQAEQVFALKQHQDIGPSMGLLGENFAEQIFTLGKIKPGTSQAQWISNGISAGKL